MWKPTADMQVMNSKANSHKQFTWSEDQLSAVSAPHSHKDTGINPAVASANEDHTHIGVKVHWIPAEPLCGTVTAEGLIQLASIQP